MGKTTRRSSHSEREETARPQRKRRKKDFDLIHFKILRAKQKLDNVEKSDSRDGKKQNRTKICNRLLPEPAAGIYRNGAKGKDIHKAETSENTFHKARLKADTIKLLNGDTHGSECTVEISTHNKTTEQLPNKDDIENNLERIRCILEESPVLENKPSRNQKRCLIKKKSEENIVENTDSNKIKQNIDDESRHVRKEDTYKRRLFQNNGKQLETTSSIRIFDTIDLTKENETNRKETEQMCSKNSKNKSPLSRYVELCKIVSAENYETDTILENYHFDPVATTIKNLRRAYTNSFHQQLLRKKKKQEMECVEPTFSMEYQACTSSDNSQLSPVEFQVPKCSENRTTTVCTTTIPPQEDSYQKNYKFHSMQNVKLKNSDNITRNSPTSCLSRNTFTTYNTNVPIVKNCRNNDIQCSKQSKNIRELSKSVNFSFMNDKDSIQSDFQKNSHVNNVPKNKRHDNFSIYDQEIREFPGYKKSQCIDNSKLLETSTFSSDSILSNDYVHEKLPIAISGKYAPNNISKKYTNRTNKYNVKNVKRVPTILRRHGNIINNKPNYLQITDNYAESLNKKCETNFNRNSSNNIEKELYETAFPNVVKNLSTSNTVNAIFDQTKKSAPQIGSMEVKDSQESLVEQFDRNLLPTEYNGNDEFYQYHGSLYPQTCEISCNSNASSKKLPRQEQISSDIKKYLVHSNNYRPMNYLQSINFSNFNVEPTKESPQQIKLHVCETNKQPFIRKNTRNQNQSIFFNNVNDRMVPTPSILNSSQNIETEKRSEIKPCQQIFDKTDVECAKNQINQNACHCNEQNISFDSANCSRKYKKQTHYFKETAEPKSLCNTGSYNNSTDNRVNLYSTLQNVPLLSLEQKNNLHAYRKAIDDQHRAVLLQNIAQPVKYLAVESNSDIKRIPVYINNKSVRVAENVPLKVIAVMDPSTQTKAFAQEIAKPTTQLVPLQTDGLHFNNFATRKLNDQSFIQHLDSVNTILFNPDSQSNIWYT